MGETANSVDSVQKQSKFKALKAEFNKIVWPDRISLAKQTVAVVGISVVLGIIIAAVDAVYKLGIDAFLG